MNFREILYCESDNNYTRFHLQDGKVVLVSKTLKKAESLLNGSNNFFRIHHSYLINMSHVKHYVRGDGGEVIMANGKSLAVSKNRRGEFLGMLERL